MVGRRRRYQWAAAVVPLMAASLAKEGRREAAHVGGLADLAAARGLDDAAVKLRRSAAATARDAAGVAGAELFWVTGPMARLAMDASQDIPVLTADSAPADDGLLVLEKPLPPWTPLSSAAWPCETASAPTSPTPPRSRSTPFNGR